MFSKINIGIGDLSSKGHWATEVHPPYLQKSSISSLKGVANSSIQSSKSTAEAFGIDKSYGTVKELSEDPQIDTVVVSVKVPLHKRLIMSALFQGKNLIVKWPLGRNREEAE